MKLLERWREIVEGRDSVLCAGLDPPPFSMGRGAMGLPEGTLKRDWIFSYLDAVSPSCGAVKPNIQYWKDAGDPELLEEVYLYAQAAGLIVIEDSKLADIGSTNGAGIYYAARRSDGVTLAPFAGNMAEACTQAADADLAIISMCLMSNPEYNNEKNKMVPVDALPGEGADPFQQDDILTVNGSRYVPQYLHLAAAAARHGADGIVVGAPSRDNHITREEIEKVNSVTGVSRVILAPGVGAQGGEASELFEVFGRDRVMVNVGRGLMFPEGSGSTPEQQQRAAEGYKNTLNDIRGGQ